MIKTSCAKIRRQNHPNITLLPTWALFCHKNTSFCMTWHIVDCALSAGSKPIVNVVGCPTGYNQPNSNTPNKMVTQKVLYTGLCTAHGEPLPDSCQRPSAKRRRRRRRLVLGRRTRWGMGRPSPETDAARRRARQSIREYGLDSKNIFQCTDVHVFLVRPKTRVSECYLYFGVSLSCPCILDMVKIFFSVFGRTCKNTCFFYASILAPKTL